MTFERFDQSRVDEILAVEKENFSDGWSREQLISAFRTGNFYCDALIVNGKTVGLITYSLTVDTADIEGVVTVTSERGKGYGKALVSRALSQIESFNKTKVFLEVRESNVPAIALYSGQDFNKISVRKNYYQDGETALVMVKELV